VLVRSSQRLVDQLRDRRQHLDRLITRRLAVIAGAHRTYDTSSAAAASANANFALSEQNRPRPDRRQPPPSLASGFRTDDEELPLASGGWLPDMGRTRVRGLVRGAWASRDAGGAGDGRRVPGRRGRSRVLAGHDRPSAPRRSRPRTVAQNEPNPCGSGAVAAASTVPGRCARRSCSSRSTSPPPRNRWPSTHWSSVENLPDPAIVTSSRLCGATDG